MNPNPSGTKSEPAWLKTIIAFPIVVSMLWFGRGFLIPLAVTGLIFILTSALVDRIGKLQLLGWSPPVWLARLTSAATVIAVILLFGVVVSDSAGNLQDALPRYQERLSAVASQLETFLGPNVVDAVERAILGIDLGSWLAAAAGQLGGALSLVALISLYLVFLMSERTKWVEKIPKMAATPQGAEKVAKILHRIAVGVKQYMWVNAVTSAMSGTVAFLIFSVIDLDFAPLLALTVFLVGFIPNIGAFIGIALPCLVALVQFDTLTPFLIVLLGYGLADQIIGNVIQPSMQGHSLNISTFMVMVSLTFFATVWGGIGAFLAVPMMVVIMVICAEIPATRWIAILLSSDGQLDQKTH